ncbi:hypothetical protein DFS34DRAFT_590656 [Phlyctochytrium arcticum]|nr:hypothetical protein DFS34DRAFT_590656 [Phlyctochytrium arcticum]
MKLSTQTVLASLAVIVTVVNAVPVTSRSDDGPIRDDGSVGEPVGDDYFQWGDKDGKGCQRWGNKFSEAKKICCPDRGCSQWQYTLNPSFPDFSSTPTKRSDDGPIRDDGSVGEPVGDDYFPWGDKDGKGCQRWGNKFSEAKKICCPDRGCSQWQYTLNPSFPDFTQ